MESIEHIVSTTAGACGSIIALLAYLRARMTTNEKAHSKLAERVAAIELRFERANTVLESVAEQNKIIDENIRHITENLATIKAELASHKITR